MSKFWPFFCKPKDGAAHFVACLTLAILEFLPFLQLGNVSMLNFRPEPFCIRFCWLTCSLPTSFLVFSLLASYLPIPKGNHRTIDKAHLTNFKTLCTFMYKCYIFFFPSQQCLFGIVCVCVCFFLPEAGHRHVGPGRPGEDRARKVPRLPKLATKRCKVLLPFF